MSPLPPPGDERREILKQRTDALAEQAETRVPEGGRIDPTALEVDNELAQRFDELQVSNKDPAYVYKWVQSGFYGRFIKRELSLGWEVVQGDMDEATELKGMGADTTRRLGDVILLRCRRDIFKRLSHQAEAHRAAVETGVTTELEELGRKAQGLGVRVHTPNDMTPEMMKKLQTNAAAKQIAIGQVDRMVRDGRMPGVPSPGSR